MNRLPHTWDALLARFGRFTDIQERALEPLFAGRNCILVSATASGKTEAALAPILERQLQHTAHQRRQAQLNTLFVVPTRALSRDLWRRLEQPLARLNLRLGVKTGDEPALKANRPPDVLITTPESLDSMLANRPRFLLNVQAVVLDELHLYADTARGDQLRVLLNRLRRLRRFAHQKGDAATAEVQFCGLSATVDEPQTLAAQYFTDPLVIHSPGHREIDEELHEFHGPASLGELFASLAGRGARKVLGFCGTRNECEQLAHLFHGAAPFGERVYAHHANLAARVRHTVEQNFARLDSGLCWATATLELGIDIGDVDLIVLVGPPPDVASFLQRIGRGNRRTKRTAVACFYRNEREHALFRVFLRQARSGGGLPGVAHAPFRPSVVAQQLFSYIKQTRTNEIEPNAAYELFHTPQGHPLLPQVDYHGIIEKLLQDKYFVTSYGALLQPGPEWEKLYQRREIYANLGGPEPVEILDDLTGRRIGFTDQPVAPGATFLLGGQPQRATRHAGRKLFVTSTRDTATHKTAWSIAPRPLSPELVRALAAEMELPIAEKTLWLLQLAEDEEETTETTLLHCAGLNYGLVLGDWLEKSGCGMVEHCDELALTIALNGPLPPFEFAVADIANCVNKRWRRLESGYAPGRWHKLLPNEVRAHYVIAAFGVERFREMFQGSALNL